MRLSERVRYFLSASTLSANSISKATGITASSLSRFKRDGAGLSVPMLDKLAEALRLDVVKVDEPKERPGKTGAKGAEQMSTARTTYKATCRPVRSRSESDARFIGYFDVPLAVPREVERDANPAHALHLLVKRRLGPDVNVTISKADSDYREAITPPMTPKNTEVITAWPSDDK